MPVAKVNSGWANGPMTSRRPAVSNDSSIDSPWAMYMMFSTHAKPIAVIPA